MSIKLSTFGDVPNDDTYTVSRGVINEDAKTATTYTGATFRNGFKVIGGKIDLVSLGFCGPASDTTGKYFVRVNVTSPEWLDQSYPNNFCWLPNLLCMRRWKWLPYTGNYRQHIYGRFQDTVIATKGKVFHIKFEKPIRIPEDTWISIEFELEGKSKTQRLKQVPNSYFHHAIETCRGRRTLIFLAGSHQMPELSFRPA